MGKATLIIILSSVVAGSVMYMQASQAKLDTTSRQAFYQEELLAREIARSAHGLARLRLQQAGSQMNEVVGSINGKHQDGAFIHGGKMAGTMLGGHYEVSAQPVDGQNIKLKTTGIFNGVREVILSYYRLEMLVVNEPSTMRVEFIDSMAGYCSAVYLQQYVPISSVEVFSELEGELSDDGEWFVKHPKMIFVAGHNRNGFDTVPADVFLQSGTRINFFIGVDTDCSEEGIWVESFDSTAYNWIHYALESDSGVRAMEEGKYTMIEAHHEDDQQWRIAFEDLRTFSDIQHADIKANGYGGSWHEEEQTYGGTGWTLDAEEYRYLHNYNSKPDFSDQVIEITLFPCLESCYSEEYATP